MNRYRFLVRRTVVAAGMGFVLFITGVGRGQTLYDSALGSLPDAQGWSYGALGTATVVVTNGAAWFDTSADATTQAGWSQRLDPDLDRGVGFTLLFSAQIERESHGSMHRAGFCVILLDAEKRGIELDFWTDSIFAQSDDPLFTRAEAVSLATTDRLTDYALGILGTNYVLRANGVAVLSGPVRDYTEFGGLISPYRIPNFLFLGDNSRSASGTTRIGRIAMVRPATLTSREPGVISWLGVPGESYTVQASPNLADWIDLGVVSATSGAYSFTNSSVLSPAQFLRVVYP